MGEVKTRRCEWDDCSELVDKNVRCCSWCVSKVWGCGVTTGRTPSTGEPNLSNPPRTADSVAFKEGKVPMELIDLDFVHDIAKQFLGGLVGGRKPDGWKELDPAVYREKCYGAALRHIRLARRGNRELDSTTKATHLAAVCANMMMVWWFEGQLAGSEAEGEGTRSLGQDPIKQHILVCSHCRWSWSMTHHDTARGRPTAEAVGNYAQHVCSDQPT